ncbi:MAG: cytochrome b/b6 domain-containing protein [Steroidobacterales bacterium]
MSRPRWLRATHWLNVAAVLVLMQSGWRIYDAAPFLPFRIPKQLTLGGWLGGALQWHFAAMWLLAANGIAYLAINLLSGRLFRTFFPVSVRALVADLLDAVKLRLAHDHPGYNAVQRFAYLFVMLDLIVIVLSGLVLWKSVQFPLLRELLGGYEAARRVHFFAMAGLVAFIAIHVTMVALVPRTLLPMIIGSRAPRLGGNVHA